MKSKGLLTKDSGYKLLSFLIVISLWKVLTLHFSPLIVPTMGSVLAEIHKILTSPDLYAMIPLTAGRLLAGLSLGVSLGLVLGILMGNFSQVKGVLSPLIGIMQTVPPVSWVVLALVWFGFNGKPAVFIVILSTLPVITINVCAGFRRIDKNLLEMASLYRFSKVKRLRHVILPSILPYFKSAFQIALGSGWKIAVMAEVLTTSDGIGGMIKLGRLNVEPESIIAWSILVVLLFYLSDFLIGKFLFRKETNYAATP